MSESEITLEAERLKALIDQWRFEVFHGSIVARDVEVWNFVRSAAEDLKQRLIVELSPRTP
ncbi:hypothetical protein RZS28_09305 [Methylocapsa polymorpha]|uniref:Uncharacterized protein n=1 Tax=Methylocapsa polymorpha TaxID=3080828 RepID=A0ABZ0HNT0_9HYPH|nr:hypothetical protein RZS28_09305 [Methylocapsa sp. RX1]